MEGKSHQNHRATSGQGDKEGTGLDGGEVSALLSWPGTGPGPGSNAIGRLSRTRISLNDFSFMFKTFFLL
jgi:hypothetical protein